MTFQTSSSAVLITFIPRLFLLVGIAYFFPLARNQWDLSSLTVWPLLFALGIWLISSIGLYVAVVAQSVEVGDGKLTVRKISGTKVFEPKNIECSELRRNGVLFMRVSNHPYLISNLGFDPASWISLSQALLSFGKDDAKGEPCDGGTEEAAQVVRREAAKRFGIKEEQFHLPLVGVLRFPPVEVIEFIEDLETDYGFSFAHKASSTTVSVEQLIGALSRQGTEESDKPRVAAGGNISC